VAASLLSLVHPKEHYRSVFVTCADCAGVLRAETLSLVVLGPVGAGLPASRVPYLSRVESFAVASVCIALMALPLLRREAWAKGLAVIGGVVWLLFGMGNGCG